MKNQQETKLIPPQEEGQMITASSSVEINDTNAAKTLFEKVKSRLLNVNSWHELAGEPLGHFHLTDAQGNDISTPVEEGNYFRIDIPGPGTNAGKGFDWVKVEKIDYQQGNDTESAGIRVRPAANPREKDSAIAHFYSDESTSTFLVIRNHNKISALVYDRNVKTNKDSDIITDLVRNTVIGSAGILTFSKIQWKSLTEGLIKN